MSGLPSLSNLQVFASRLAHLGRKIDWPKVLEIQDDFVSKVFISYQHSLGGFERLPVIGDVDVQEHMHHLELTTGSNIRVGSVVLEDPVLESGGRKVVTSGSNEILSLALITDVGLPLILQPLYVTVTPAMAPQTPAQTLGGGMTQLMPGMWKMTMCLRLEFSSSSSQSGVSVSSRVGIRDSGSGGDMEVQSFWNMNIL
ncbi:hypothetical protein BS47DRAFT_1367552 [Hydnum rufescens UP504]|uniref:Uncharacterized protein n=1 Tax=Hydnum rufescens UP504 TaxID=1448309 RepID=A0A9P6DQ13_9AGAM|nr:hypothetical protein BS47DRAFT_1367552 [Hydnum rufescens UP504]